MGIKIDHIKHLSIDDEAVVSLKKMGNIYEVCWCEHSNHKASILKIDKNHYMLNSTGEIKESRHIKNRLQNKAQLSQSFKRLRELINTNVTDVKNCKWITLTYREQMKDTKKAYQDYDKFIKRFKYKYGDIEYINVCEPCGDGRWHFHCLIIFPNKAPFIPNSDIEKIWGLGYTKTQRLYGNIDNIGAYLSAYISDIPLDEVSNIGIDYNNQNIKAVYELDGKKLDKPKYFVKGARLNLYPPNFKLYRTSRGIKKPKKEYMSYKEAKEKIGFREPTYSKSIQLIDTDGQFTNKIIYEHYNTRRSKNKSDITRKAIENIDIPKQEYTPIKSHILNCFKVYFYNITSIYTKVKKHTKQLFKKVIKMIFRE